MGYLHNILPEKKRGFHFSKSRDILPFLDRILEGGDCLLIKASLSVGMKEVSNAISNLECPE
jgi:UDP-N-acetylmuramyl pentapeptide synthase